MAFQTPKGVNDLLPKEAFGHQHLIRTAFEVFGSYGYRYMETPTFEKTEVFTRGIGEATDVVGKELYYAFPMSSVAKAGEGDAAALGELALRPENTAGFARAVVQHNLVPPGAPVAKLWYAGSMFRHERQQKGRYREFHQIGAECYGASESSADAEVIIMLMEYFIELGIPSEQMTLKINSMGDDECRPVYRAAVREFILAHKEDMCPDCLRRAETNPLRAFDCKNPRCNEVLADAPKITDFLCEDCSAQYQAVKKLLSTAEVAFEEDPRLVRGLDYYTRTVFEVQVDAGLGSQNAIGGGGRYDNLLEEYGAKHTPSLGFAVGLERILMVLEEFGKAPALPAAAQVFVAAVDEEARDVAFSIASSLRKAGVACELDHQGRSLKSQFKVADKLEVAFVVIVGPEEIEQARYKLRNMNTHEEQELALEELLQLLSKG